MFLFLALYFWKKELCLGKNRNLPDKMSQHSPSLKNKYSNNYNGADLNLFVDLQQYYIDLNLKS